MWLGEIGKSDAVRDVSSKRVEGSDIPGAAKECLTQIASRRAIGDSQVGGKTASVIACGLFSFACGGFHNRESL